MNATSASKPVTEPNSRRATFTRDDAKNETMQMSALRPKEKNGKASNNAFISVPVTKKSAPSSTNQTTTFLSPQFTEGLVIAIACLLVVFKRDVACTRSHTESRSNRIK